MDNYSTYLKFVTEALELSRSIPKYFSRFSNKIYDNHQKLVIVVLMQKMKMTSREIVEWLKANEEIRLLIGLCNRIPVHTTVIRFLNRIKYLLNKFFSIRQACKLGIDASGFELETKSYYYRRVYNMKNKQKTKKYMKLSIAVDLDNQLILQHKIRRGPRNDNIDFKNLLNDLNVDYVLADKGYSSKANRKLVLEKQGIPIIPYKKCDAVYRFPDNKRLKFSKKLYGQRAKVETVFSVIKRKYGSVLRCKSFATQKAELTCKLIAYNLDRKIKMVGYYLLGLHQSSYCGALLKKSSENIY